MEVFRKHITQPYDQGNSVHEAHLVLLWSRSFPQEKLSNRITNEWKRLGFQVTNSSFILYSLREIIQQRTFVEADFLD